MTTTHLSHFGITKLGESRDSIIFAGTLAACKRLAAAHGMEIESYRGRTVSTDCGRAIYAPSSPDSFVSATYVGGGLLHKGQDDWALVMPLEVWRNG